MRVQEYETRLIDDTPETLRPAQRTLSLILAAWTIEFHRQAKATMREKLSDFTGQLDTARKNAIQQRTAQNAHDFRLVQHFLVIVSVRSSATEL